MFEYPYNDFFFLNIYLQVRIFKLKYEPHAIENSFLSFTGS